jgi:hypothetical protein
MATARTRAFVATIVCLAAGAVTTRAQAEDTRCSGCRDDQIHPEILHMEFGYQRMALPVAGTNFGSSTLPSHTGSELGFVTPTANMMDFHWTLFAGRGLGFVSDFAVGWAGSDAPATDAFAQHVTGSMVIANFGFGLEGIVPLGGGVNLRAAATTGPQLLMIPVDIPSANGRNQGLAAVQWFIRPRVALEGPLADHVMLGTYLTDDLLRVRSWGGGAYVAFAF